MHQQTTLATLDYDALAAAFNLVYTDYIMPVRVNAAWIQGHVAQFDIALDHSPLWLDDAGAVVGLAVLGIRGARGWVGGFGIAPDYRGRGLSHRLCDAALHAARAAGLAQVQLELITSNTAAIRAYERAGFVQQRDLLILTRPSGALTIDVDTTAAQDADLVALLQSRATMTAAAPAWQNEPASNWNATDLYGLVVGDPTAPLAMCLYRTNTAHVRLADIAAIDLSSAQTLLAALIDREPNKPMTIINEPDASEPLPALLNLGWVESMRQHEMLVTL